MRKHKEYLEGQRANIKAAKDYISEGERERVEELKAWIINEITTVEKKLEDYLFSPQILINKINKIWTEKE